MGARLGCRDACCCVFLFHGSAFCIHRRNWRTIRSPWTFPAVSTLSHREKPRRSREPSSSLAERQQQRNDSGTTASIRRKPCGTRCGREGFYEAPEQAHRYASRAPPFILFPTHAALVQRTLHIHRSSLACDSHAQPNNHHLLPRNAKHSAQSQWNGNNIPSVHF